MAPELISKSTMSVTALKANGFGLKTLKQVSREGFELSGFVAAGFTAKELKDADSKVSDLIKAKAKFDELIELGFEPQDFTAALSDLS